MNIPLKMSSEKTWTSFLKKMPFLNFLFFYFYLYYLLFIFDLSATKSVSVSLNSFSTGCLEEGTRDLADCVGNVPPAAPLENSPCPKFEDLEDGNLHVPSNFILNILYKLAAIKSR